MYLSGITGGWEWVLIVLAVLILFGSKKILISLTVCPHCFTLFLEDVYFSLSNCVIFVFSLFSLPVSDSKIALMRLLLANYCLVFTLIFIGLLFIGIASKINLSCGCFWNVLTTFIDILTSFPWWCSSLCLAIMDFSLSSGLLELAFSACSSPLVYPLRPDCLSYAWGHSLHLISYTISFFPAVATLFCSTYHAFWVITFLSSGGVCSHHLILMFRSWFFNNSDV